MNILSLLKYKGSVAYLFDDNTLRQGLEKMRYHGYTAIPVITRDGIYKGTVSEGDFLWHCVDSGKYDIKEQEIFTVDDIIRPDWNPPAKISISIEDLVNMVMDQNFVPMIDDRGVFIGIITRKDIIRSFCDKFKENMGNCISE